MNEAGQIVATGRAASLDEIEQWHGLWFREPGFLDCPPLYKTRKGLSIKERYEQEKRAKGIQQRFGKRGIL